jgi:hypothetical protein
MSTKTGSRLTYHGMTTLAIVVGIVSIALQFLPGWDLMAYMLSGAALGGLAGGFSGYSEDERQHLEHSYKTDFEWLLLAVMVIYAIILLAQWLNFASELTFINGHWPVLVIALMCTLLGLAGFRKSAKAA